MLYSMNNIHSDNNLPFSFWDKMTFIQRWIKKQKITTIKNDNFLSWLQKQKKIIIMSIKHFDTKETRLIIKIHGFVLACHVFIIIFLFILNWYIYWHICYYLLCNIILFFFCVGPFCYSYRMGQIII